MPFRKLSVKDSHYIQLRNKYKTLSEEFEDYAELLSLEQGKVAKSSNKARSYAKHVLYLAVLYEEHFQQEISNLATVEGLGDLERVVNLAGFKTYNMEEGRFPNAAINCFKRFIHKKEGITYLKTDRTGIELNQKVLTQHIAQFITQKGFTYTQQNITNLYISLRTKPFVILSGISGTGKTKIVQLFANAVGANYENGRYRLISVRPNWSDSSDLLGYTDLKGDFVCGQLTDMIIRAANNPEYPYFVVLDEMNLARVEYYLSDYLSVIESRDWYDDGIETSPIVQVKDEDCDEKREYGLPENLYIIGTVNMDETTYPFSKKVLDRANSIEFNDINLKAYMTKPAEQNVEPIEVSNKHFVSEYLYFKDIYPQHEGIIDRVSTQLEAMNEQLKEIYAHVGYRVRDEICFYMIYAQDTDLTEDEAMDFCVMQKILPRISGAGEEIEKLLKAFYQDFAGIAYDEKGVVPADARYPRSAKKVAEMLKRLRIQGFTSFWAS